MNTLGAELQEAREKQNVSLRQIAEETRISFRYLEDLEKGRYDQLPGGVYNRAFLRAYCEYLGLDSMRMLDRYEAEVAPPTEKASKTKATLTRENRVAANAVVVWSSLLVLAAVGLYMGRGWVGWVVSSYLSRSSPSAIPIQKPLTRQLSVSFPASPPVPPAPVVTSSSADPSETRALNSSTPSPGNIRLEFKVMEQCWVSVNIDGNRTLVKLLEPGNDQTFDASERFYIILGNAGGVLLNINGKAAKRIGRRGEVVRLLINEQNIQDLLDTKTKR